VDFTLNSWGLHESTSDSDGKFPELGKFLFPLRNEYSLKLTNCMLDLYAQLGQKRNKIKTMEKDKRTDNPPSRTPARRLTREDLVATTGGNRLMFGCCAGQGCCHEPENQADGK
jgi:hypothetical protein